MAKKKTISLLIVESDADEQKKFKSYFDGAAAEVFVVAFASTLEEVDQYLKHQTVEAILLEMDLPDSQGLKTLSHVSKYFPDIAIVVSTDIIHEAVEYKTIKQGAPEYLFKGKYTKHELIRAIKRAIDSKRQMHTLEVYRRRSCKLLKQSKQSSLKRSEQPTERRDLFQENEKTLKKLDNLTHDDLLTKPANQLRFDKVKGVKQKLSEQYARERVMENAISFAIEKGELYLVYQPIVSLKTREIQFFEGQLRWHSETLGDVSPDEFIPIAERTPVISEVTRWVIETCCKQLQQWRLDEGITPVIAVNLSSSDLSRVARAQDIFAILKRYDVSVPSLKTELADTAVAGNEQREENVLDKLNKAGAQVVIDDFGTWYLSFNRTKRLPINVIKLDNSLIKNMIRNERDAQVVQSILALADALDLEVVAEGVETEEMADYLEHLGCGSGQGYFFAKPLSSEDVISYISGKRVGENEERAVADLTALYTDFRAIGHNIANALAAITGFSNLLLVSDSQSRYDELAVITKETDKLVDLIRELSKGIQKDQLERSVSRLKEREETFNRYVKVLSKALDIFIDKATKKIRRVKKRSKQDEEAYQFLIELEQLIPQLRQYQQALGEH